MTPVTTRVWLAPLAASLISGCAAEIAPLPAKFMGATATMDVRVPVASVEERKFATVVRQRYDFSCGSASLATLLRYHYGLKVDEESVFRGMWRNGDREQIKKLGFSLLDMKRYLAAHGMRADGYKVGLDEVAKAGVPGVALLDIKGYRHFVVLKGMVGDELLVGDPSLGLRTLSRRDFLAGWNGVYFVIDEAPGAEPVFNGRAQWASLARGPARGRFLEPVSQQALMLTAPFYRDF